ncbi:hypothetical protein V6N13_088862 [Hibiscus sabdariffa]
MGKGEPLDESVYWSPPLEKYVALIGVIQSINLRCGLVNVYGPSNDSDKNVFLLELVAFLELWDPPTFVRLDRFLISTDFEFAFSEVFQTVLGKSISYHNATILSETRKDWGPKPFKCFNFWFGEVVFVDIVTKKLTDLKQKNPGIRIGGLIKGAKLALKQWSGNSFRDTGKSITMLEKEISDLESRLQSEDNVQHLLIHLQEVRACLWKELRREESSWLQKS